MNRVAPKLVRRALIAPLTVGLGAVALVAAIPLLLIALFVDLVARRPLPTTRLAGVALVHVIFEAVGVVCLVALWIASVPTGGVDAPVNQDRHHRFVRWWLGVVIGITGRLLGIRVAIEDARPPKAGPVLVFSRHAGPWDSFLLAHSLVHGYERRPRIVMKASMQWSPVIDLIGNRLPNRFIRPGGPAAASFIDAIEDLARNLDDHDALILFPEGGNFTVKRRLAAIERLVREGHLEHAAEARMLTNLIAPRPGGVLAAMRGAPDADVVFVAHTGLEPLVSVAELWRAVPLRAPLLGRYWRVPPAEIPLDERARIDWLFDWWERIDTWIESRLPTGGG